MASMKTRNKNDRVMLARTVSLPCNCDPPRRHGPHWTPAPEPESQVARQRERTEGLRAARRRRRKKEDAGE